MDGYTEIGFYKNDLLHGFARKDDQDNQYEEGLYENDQFKGYNTDAIKCFDGKRDFIAQ